MELEEIYNRYAKDVFRFTLSLCGNTHVAEDITSETFIKAIKMGDTFEGRCSIKVWLCQIAKNTYFDYLRKHSKIAEFPEEIPDENDFVLELLDKDEALKIHKYLHQLDEPYKEVFSLRIFSELSFLEISEIFGKTESWARVTFHRAKSKMKELCKNEKL